MDKSRQQWLDERAGAWEVMQDILASHTDEEREWSPDERIKFDRANEAITECDQQIRACDDRTREARAEAMDYSTERSSIVENVEVRDADDTHILARKDYDAAFRAFMKNEPFQDTGPTDAEQRGLLHKGVQEMRAQGVATGAAGGYFVPQGFLTRIIEQQKYFSNLRSVSDVISTNTGQPLAWPTTDDTSNVGAILAENTQISQQDVTIGTAALGAYMYTSKAVLVSYQLLQDSVFNVDNFLARKLGERLGRIQNTHFTVGTGSSQPLGVAYSPTVGKTGTTGQTTSVIYDDIVDLIHSIDPAYRAGGSQRFMLHDLSLAKLRKLKDTTGRPLWQPQTDAGMVGDTPGTLLGYPYMINNDMPVMAANAYSILFGDFNRYYIIRDVLGVSMMRLTERYADYLQVGFFAYQRTDATVQDASAVKSYRNSAT